MQRIQEDERKRGTRAPTKTQPPPPTLELERFCREISVFESPARVQMLSILLKKEGWVCVCDLVESLGLSQPTISHHLKVLRQAELVDYERRGIWAYYFVRRADLARLKDRIIKRLHALQ